MVQIDVFSQGKNGEAQNEDHYGYNDHTFVVADGMTDKSNKLYSGQTGGKLASGLVIDTCLSSELDSTKLVAEINMRLFELYRKLGIIEQIGDPTQRFGCGFICGRLKSDELTITYLGDLGFRINGQEVYREEKRIDSIAARIRARHIQRTGDVDSSRNRIKRLLLRQIKFQNSTEPKYGYGVIDGTTTPEQYIKTFQYIPRDLTKLEVFTDGYFKIPKGTTINDWEQAYQYVERIDPDKCKQFKSTKSKDDRTIMIVTF